VGSRNHHLFAIDAVTGELKWCYKTGGPIFSSPAVVDGAVYIGSNDGYLYAIESESDGQ
jgi:outer membrane protein assembly factor BamB